jgi:endonuclease/exonuclease/phosphatase family metal-dependent hydrolase
MARPLRIVSYNVRYFAHALKGLASTGKCKAGIAAGLVRLSPTPDLICLQEVETISLRSKVAFRMAPATETQLESFMDSFETAHAVVGLPFPYEAFYFRAHAYKLGTTALYTTGLAALVNTLTLKVESHNVAAPAHITHHHVQRFRDTKQSRICAHVTLKDTRGQRFHLFNTHLSLPTPFARQFWSHREKMGFGVNQLHEARTLAHFVQHHAGAQPFVVCGDFNSSPASPVYRFLREEAGFGGAQETLGLIDPQLPKGFATAGFMRLRMHLDHLFSGNGVRWLDMDGTRPVGEGPFEGLSDHMPLIGRFELP